MVDISKLKDGDIVTIKMRYMKGKGDYHNALVPANKKYVHLGHVPVGQYYLLDGISPSIIVSVEKPPLAVGDEVKHVNSGTRLTILAVHGDSAFVVGLDSKAFCTNLHSLRRVD